jgi:hypothetical protein
MTSKSFAALWQRDHWRYALPAAGLSVAGAAFSVLPLATGIAVGAVGWPLMGLTCAGLLGGLAWQAVRTAERGPVLDTYAHDKAPQPLQDIAENLFRKAGLTVKPDIRLLSANLPQLRGMHRSVCIILDDPKQNGTVPILLGRQVAGSLDAEEITAILAHAAARVMVRPHAAGPSYKISRVMQASVMAAGMLTLNMPVLALGLAGSLARRALAAKARLSGDLLADRNAIALYPHPAALISASGKVQETVLDGRRHDFSWFRQTYRAWENALYTRFVMREQREAALAVSFSEVKAFNAHYRLPPDGRDVLSLPLRAAWKAERAPYFWEKIRLPGPAPHDPEPLRSAWDKDKKKQGAPCDSDCSCPPPKLPAPGPHTPS